MFHLGWQLPAGYGVKPNFVSTTNVVTNTDGTVVTYISVDHIAVAPLLGLAAIVLALVFVAWWVVSKQRKSKSN